MRSTKYVIVQDGNGWRGFLQGYPEHEMYGDSFEELQFKLWQLHQDLIAQEAEPHPYHYHNGPGHAPHASEEHDRHHSPTSTLPRHTPAKPRPMSRAQSKRRARVEQLLFSIISNR